MGLFNKAPPPAAAAPTTLATNAPESWPPIRVEAEAGEEVMLNYLHVASELERTIGTKENIKVGIVFKTFMFDDGLIDVPIEVIEGGKRTMVFVYSMADEGVAGHWLGVKQLFQRYGFPQPVYYAPSDLEKYEGIMAKNPLKKLTTSSMKKYTGEVAHGTYAMWWSGQSEPSFNNSPTMGMIHSIYENSEGIYSYLFADFLMMLKVVERGTSQVALPPKPFSVALKGPEDVMFLLTVSQDKGIRFHFNKATTHEAYRQRFLNLYDRYVYEFKSEVQKLNLPQDPPSQLSPLQWWYKNKSTLAQLDSQGQVVPEFGSINR